MIRFFNKTVGRDRSTPFTTIAILLVASAVFVFAFASPSRAEPEVRFGAALSLTGSKATEGKLVKDGYSTTNTLRRQDGGGGREEEPR